MSEIIEGSKTAIDKQHAKGLKKYAGPLEDTKPTAPELINHTIEKAADQPNYLVASREEVARLQAGIFQIMASCRDGKVCDDVAWFDAHATLWDHCTDLVGWPHEYDGRALPTDPPTDADVEYLAVQSTSSDRGGE